MKWRSKEKNHAHWIQHANDKYDEAYISDCRSVWDLFLLFLPLPMFWALFDQQGSTWTMQSAHMDGRLGNVVELQPDQMDSLNAFLIICFIPLFSFVVYPLFAKCNLLTKPLQRMTTGGFLAAISFILAGILQLIIEKDMPVYPLNTRTEIIFANTLPCRAKLDVGDQHFNLEAFGYLKVSDLVPGQLKATISPEKNENCTFVLTTFTIEANGGKPYTFAVGAKNNDLVYKQIEDSRTRHPKGQPMVRFIYALEETPGYLIWSPSNATKINETFGILEYVNPPSNKKYDLCWSKTESCADAAFSSSFYSSKGGFIDVMIIVNNRTQIKEEFIVVRPDSLNMLWQIPQYVLITAGEILFSITGLAFAYSQAPYTMKSVLQSAWLLTVAFGNIIVIIIEEIKGLFADRLESTGFFTYASLMIVDMMIFAWISYRYKYKVFTAPETELKNTNS